MSNGKDESTEKAKPEGNTDPDIPSTPDVKHEGWSAEQIAEQSAYKDGTEVKKELEEGKEAQQEGGQ